MEDDEITSEDRSALRFKSTLSLSTQTKHTIHDQLLINQGTLVFDVI